MLWTNQKPIKPGWYWVKITNYPQLIVKFVFDSDQKNHPLQPEGTPFSTEAYEWFAGPIAEPEAHRYFLLAKNAILCLGDEYRAGNHGWFEIRREDLGRTKGSVFLSPIKVRRKIQ